MLELSVVVPVYKEEDNVSEFVRRVVPILSAITAQFEIIFAMDPSPDKTEAVLSDLHRKDPRVKLLKFSRRFGQPMATLAGLTYSTGKAVIVMDVDLQDPPELVPELVARWKQGYDVVYAQRINRQGETLIKRVVSYLGYKLINRIAEVEIPPHTGDFRLMSRRVVNHLIELKETHGFLRGMVALVGFRQAAVQFERPARFSGSGHYNRFLGSLRIGMNGVVCFSNYLLGLSSLMGFLIALGSFLLAFAYGIAKLLGVPFPLGNPTIVVLVLFLGGVQLISVGVLGEYIGRIYDEVKGRPRFIVDRKEGFES